MINIILKGTNGCNLACSYCSLGKKETFITPTKEEMYHIMQYACNVAKFQKEQKIAFILHGGEPTLIPIETYEFAIKKTEEEFEDLEIEFSMQTNAFHISDNLIDFIQRHDIHVGVSMDGGEDIHDKERTNIAGEPTFKTIQNNILKLLAQDIPVSCLMVLTSNALNTDYRYLNFFAEHRIHLKINPLLNYGEVYEHPELSLKKGEYSSYLIELYKYIIKNKIDVEISPMDKIIQGILYYNNNLRECSFRKNCNDHFLCIDYKGDVYPCGKFSDMDKYRICNIKDKNYAVFHGDIITMLQNRRNANLPVKCTKCKYLTLCNGGCNAEASISGSLEKEPLLCDDYYELFHYFHGEGLRLLRDELVKEKQILGS